MIKSYCVMFNSAKLSKYKQPADGFKCKVVHFHKAEIFTETYKNRMVKVGVVKAEMC